MGRALAGKARKPKATAPQTADRVFDIDMISSDFVSYVTLDLARDTGFILFRTQMSAKRRL